MINLREKQGFTLFELIVVVAVLSITTTTLIASYSGFNRAIDLETTQRNIVSDIRAAQIKAMAGVQNSNWGTCFVNSGADNFYAQISSTSQCNSLTSQSTNIIYLPTGITFSNPAANTRKYVMFTKIEGSATTGSDDVVKITSANLNESRNITISSQGRINISTFNVVTDVATNITSSSAVLNGSANPNEAETTVWFIYSSQNPSSCGANFNGIRAPVNGVGIGSGVFAVSFSDSIPPAGSPALTPSTTYYYCAVASNATGAIYGRLRSFTTTSQ